MPHIVGGRDKLTQVFLNFINNSADAMPEGGKLTIRTERTEDRKDDEVRIIFTDSENGISEKNISKIFSPFFTTKPADKGTGLGLSICFSIIEHHMGAISVESLEGAGQHLQSICPWERGICMKNW